MISKLHIRPANEALDLIPSAVAEWTELVNRVYLTSEADFWKDGYFRINAEEFEANVRAGHLLLAFLDNEKAGIVKVRQLDDETGDFGMLVTRPEFRKMGIGGKLVAAAEAHLASLGCTTIRLEILFPQDWVHPEKEMLDQWYRRLGYLPVKRVDFFAYYPEKRENAKCGFDFVVYEKERDSHT